MRSCSSRIVVAMAVGLTSVGCAQPDLFIGDYEQIRDRGVLRAIVRPGFENSALEAGSGPSEARLLRELAGRIGVTLETIEAPRHDQILEWLHEGRGDIAVERFSPRDLRREGFAASAAVAWVEDLLVTTADGPVRDFESVRSRTVHLHRSRAPAIHLELQSATGGGSFAIRPVPEEVSLETVAFRVQAGRYENTVLDSGIVEALSLQSGLRSLGPVGETRALAWALRSTSPRLLAAVNDFLFAEQVLARSARSVACRDLEAIRSAGVIRLVTRNSPTTCIIERGGLEGFEYDLAHEFASSLGVRLELTLPPPGVEPSDWLEKGYGDFAALHEPAELDPRPGFLNSDVYRVVDLVPISSLHREPVHDVFLMGGQRVVAPGPVQTYVEELPLDPPPILMAMGAGEDALSALRAVTRGDADVAVIDQDTARLELEHRDMLVAGEPVVKEVGLVWLFASHAQNLKREADRFLRSSRRSGFIRLLARSELGIGGRWSTRSMPEVPPDALTPYDDLLRLEARRQGMDWRLLASLMYEESRFDPNAVGPGGSAGLFQFMPFTWRELGVENPHDPAQAAGAAAVYLKRLMAFFDRAELSEQMAMAIASYNVGPRHVVDAQKLATEMGLDDRLWSGHVETAMLILDEADVARGYPAGVCRCRRAVGYTRRILRRYEAYAEQFPPA